MPVFEYHCMAHGKFDKLLKDGSVIPSCPNGCSPKMVRRVLTAPYVMSGGTTAADNALRAIADQHHLTDMNNQNGTAAVQRTSGDMMSGVTRPMALGKTVGESLGSMGMQGGNALADLKSSFKQPKPIVQGSWNG